MIAKLPSCCCHGSVPLPGSVYVVVDAAAVAVAVVLLLLERKNRFLSVLVLCLRTCVSAFLFKCLLVLYCLTFE